MDLHFLSDCRKLEYWRADETKVLLALGFDFQKGLGECQFELYGVVTNELSGREVAGRRYYVRWGFFHWRNRKLTEHESVVRLSFHAVRKLLESIADVASFDICVGYFQLTRYRDLLHFTEKALVLFGAVINCETFDNFLKPSEPTIDVKLF